MKHANPPLRKRPPVLKTLSESQFARKTLGFVARFFVGFFIARAVTFGEYAPFGLGYTAAIAPFGLAGVFGSLGVLVGYLRLWTLADSIKYIAGTVLIYTVIAAFRGTKTFKKRFFAPIAAVLCSAGVGFVFIVGRGFTGVNVALFFCELVLVFGFSFFAGELFSPSEASKDRNARTFSILVVVAAAALGASGFTTLAGISFGRVAAVLVILCAAHAGGLAAGAAAGVTLGVVFDIGGGGGFYSMSYGLCGLLAGAVARNDTGKSRSRFASAAVYVVAGGAMVLVENSGGPRFSVLYETFAASVVFMLLPDGLLPDGFEFFSRVPQSVTTDTGAAASVLSRVAGAYSALGAALSPQAVRREVNTDAAFMRAARHACARCPQSAACWKDSSASLKELRTAVDRLRDRAEMEAADLPTTFAARCLRPAEFAHAVTEEYRVGQMELRREVRAARGTELAREQTARVASVLNSVAENLHGKKDAKPRVRVDISAASRRRKDSGESGDRGTWFKTPDGDVVILLSDGMGSGTEAAQASSEMLRLTEGFMTAGVDANDAVAAVSGALQAGGREVFATLDLLRLGLANGDGDIVKCGAAPSYIRGSGAVCKVGGESLPPGLDGTIAPVSRRFNLSACEYIVMVTDGVTDGLSDENGGDRWLRELLENFEGTSNALALAIVTAAAEKTDCADDISVVAIKVD